jgi:hypothetical protein
LVSLPICGNWNYGADYRLGYFSDVINIRWFWAGTAFFMIGGGSAVIKAMLFAMLADVASEDKR